jgi:hypothetical protein
MQQKNYMSLYCANVENKDHINSKNKQQSHQQFQENSQLKKVCGQNSWGKLVEVGGSWVTALIFMVHFAVYTLSVLSM